MVCFVVLSLTKRRKGKDTQKIGIEKNGTTPHQKQKDKEKKRKRAKRQGQLKRMAWVVMLDTCRKTKGQRDRNSTDKEEKHEKKDELKSMAGVVVLDTDGWESGTSKGQLCINFFLLLSPFSPAFLSHASLVGGSVQTLCHNC